MLKKKILILIDLLINYLVLYVRSRIFHIHVHVYGDVTIADEEHKI
jgi:hypothetical protein